MNDKPWLVPSAIEWLDRYLAKDMLAFEWGMGGSTLWYAERIDTLVSIEHDEKYYIETTSELARQKISNVLARRIPLDDSHNYAQAIDQFFDEYDYIAIDGRRRAECIQHAIPRLKSNGVLLLDNSERPEYAGGIALMVGWKHIDFVDEWQTSVYMKP